MQKLLLLLLCFAPVQYGLAQNIGIGTSNPVTKLDVNGNFKVSAEYMSTTQQPTAAQIKNMTAGGLTSMNSTDSVIRLFDPGGPSGNYAANQTGTFVIASNIEPMSYVSMTIENIDLGTGDSIIVYETQSSTGPVLLRIGDGYNNSQPVIYFPGNVGQVYFKSNADASVGNGFSLLFKRNFIKQPNIPETEMYGSALKFYGQKASLRAGAWGNGNMGNFSTAFGLNNTASGNNSIALGNTTTASGVNAVSMGESSIASGYSATAMGRLSEATGNYSLATGSATEASGMYATALGNATTASGMGSTAINWVSTASGDYSFAAGFNTRAKAYSMAIGRYNTINAAHSETAWLADDFAFVIGDGTSNANRSDCFYILKNGNGWMQGTLTQSSDARLKKNIQPLSKSLEKITNLHGYTYQWKDSSLPGVQAGMLAQEVQEQMPELVIPNADGQLAVNYSGLIPYLVESIKTLEQQNNALLERISRLEKKRRKKSAH